jgi:3-oxoacyl-[acyl-carrier protein] reductase
VASRRLQPNRSWLFLLSAHDRFSCSSFEEIRDEGWRAAAKAGIQMLTQHLAAQVGAYGIRVNCIAPETILTERTTSLIPDAQKKAMAESHPIKRLGTPEDVARAAVFLASAQSEWITGLIMDVSGGSVMST